jgi:hypothetical protein
MEAGDSFSAFAATSGIDRVRYHFVGRGGRIVNRTARVNSHPTTQTDSMNSANCWSAAVSVWIISPFFAAGAWLFGAFGFLVWYWR